MSVSKVWWIAALSFVSILASVLAAAGTLQPLNEASYPHLIGQHSGRVLLVDFWATWCEPCRDEMPVLVELQKKFGFVLLTVSADEPEQEADALKFLATNHVALPAWIKRPKNDETFINAVDPKWSGALPGLFLYDRAGKLRQSLIGETDRKELETALRKLL